MQCGRVKGDLCWRCRLRGPRGYPPQIPICPLPCILYTHKNIMLNLKGKRKNENVCPPPPPSPTGNILGAPLDLCPKKIQFGSSFLKPKNSRQDKQQQQNKKQQKSPEYLPTICPNFTRFLPELLQGGTVAPSPSPIRLWRYMTYFANIAGVLKINKLIDCYLEWRDEWMTRNYGWEIHAWLNTQRLGHKSKIAKLHKHNGKTFSMMRPACLLKMKELALPPPPPHPVMQKKSCRYTKGARRYSLASTSPLPPCKSSSDAPCLTVGVRPHQVTD